MRIEYPVLLEKLLCWEIKKEEDWNITSNRMIFQYTNPLSTIKKNKKNPETSDLAVVEHFFDLPHHNFKFEEAKLINSHIGLLLRFCEISEIKQ